MQQSNELCLGYLFVAVSSCRSSALDLSIFIATVNNWLCESLLFSITGVPAMSDAPVIMFRPRAWNMLEFNMMVRTFNPLHAKYMLSNKACKIICTLSRHIRARDGGVDGQKGKHSIPPPTLFHSLACLPHLGKFLVSLSYNVLIEAVNMQLFKPFDILYRSEEGLFLVHCLTLVFTCSITASLWWKKEMVLSFTYQRYKICSLSVLINHQTENVKTSHDRSAMTCSLTGMFDLAMGSMNVLHIVIRVIQLFPGPSFYKSTLLLNFCCLF